MIIQEHISKIKQLKPLTTGCVYKTAKWENLDGEHKEIVRDFENKWVSRADVIKSFEDYYSDKNGYMRAFLLTMIWGFEDAGYGTYRTNNYILIPENVEKINVAFEAVKSNDIKRAFKTLKSINGLGISYLSKVLYFATRGLGMTEYSLIFDIRVARSLVQLTAPAVVFELINIYPSDKYEDYQKYNAMIHYYAKQYNVEAESIELFLFNQKF
jgi:hypothetical protein